tara:strand:- start:357 stop:2915 length:2559 start_codon:yes stop_codon:yes gene_type:complete
MNRESPISNKNKNIIHQSIENLILDSNPIMEAFGNASTERNHNSSRFGKFIKLFFNSKNRMVGAKIETYLLEIVRICSSLDYDCDSSVTPNRNFHFFYQFLAGCSEEDKCKYNITWHQDFSSKPQFHHDKNEFTRTMNALKQFEFNEQEIDAIFAIISSILHCKRALNDQTYKKQCLKIVSTLLSIPYEELDICFHFRKIKAGTDICVIPLDEEVQTVMLETFIKTIYQRLFDWIIEKINRKFKDTLQTTTANKSFIGLLDIFGFELFDNNGFEQLCINYTNEMLQYLFNNHIFSSEQEEYIIEGIDWTTIDFPNNNSCIELFNNSTKGIFSLLDQECMFPNGNSTAYLSKLKKNYNDHLHFKTTSKQFVNNQFTIVHYAGPVHYNVTNFCEKNSNKIHKGILNSLAIAKNTSIHIILNRGILRKPPAKKQSFLSKSVSYSFKNQVQSLISMLQTTNTHYIRCIKPNNQQTAFTYDEQKVVEQLRFSGVLEVIKISKAGYPIRIEYEEFARNFSILTKCNTLQYNKKVATNIVEKFVKDDRLVVQYGKTKLFMKKDAYNTLHTKRIQKVYKVVSRIQSVARKWIQYRYYTKLKRITVNLQSLVRMKIAIKVVNRKRLKKSSAIYIQSWWRGRREVKRFKYKLRRVYNTITIQRWYKQRLFIREINKRVEIKAKSKQTITLQIEPQKEKVNTQPVPVETAKINTIENKISKMENAFELLLEKMSCITDSNLEKNTPEKTKEIKQLEKVCEEKNNQIKEQDTQIKEQETQLKKQENCIKKQKKLIESDQQVKIEMAERLQQVLLDKHKKQTELERARTEIMRLRTFQQQLLRERNRNKRRRKFSSIWEDIFGGN